MTKMFVSTRRCDPPLRTNCKASRKLYLDQFEGEDAVLEKELAMEGVDESRVGDMVVVVAVVAVESLRLDQMRLQEFVAAAATHGQNPTDQRTEEHRHQNGESDGEESEEFVEI